ncbi:MAG: hypothetical protein L0H96_01930 [Humibacillus sp.]|nr:hypothetical protein [Humibacillus sp.]MDN5775653.1 hypothetical protein [Humibacillus sp.]
MLDAYHLAEGREVGEGLAFLLEHLPSRVHVRGQLPGRSGSAALADLGAP